MFLLWADCRLSFDASVGRPCWCLIYRQRGNANFGEGWHIYEKCQTSPQMVAGLVGNFAKVATHRDQKQRFIFSKAMGWQAVMGLNFWAAVWTFSGDKQPSLLQVECMPNSTHLRLWLAADHWWSLRSMRQHTNRFSKHITSKFIITTQYQNSLLGG